MSLLEEKINTITSNILNNDLVTLQDKTSLNKKSINQNVLKFKALKQEYKTKYTNIINVLTELIEDIDNNDDEVIDESPASIKQSRMPVFSDESTLYKHKSTIFDTFTCQNTLKGDFTIKFLIHKCTESYFSIGFNTEQIEKDSEHIYLGTHTKYGKSWGWSSNSNIAINGSWIGGGEKFTSGDTVTLIRENDKIQYKVNDHSNSYNKEFTDEDLYLAFTVYFKDESVEILELS